MKKTDSDLVFELRLEMQRSEDAQIFQLGHDLTNQQILTLWNAFKDGAKECRQKFLVKRIP